MLPCKVCLGIFFPLKGIQKLFLGELKSRWSRLKASGIGFLFLPVYLKLQIGIFRSMNVDEGGARPMVCMKLGVLSWRVFRYSCLLVFFGM